LSLLAAIELRPAGFSAEEIDQILALKGADRVTRVAGLPAAQSVRENPAAYRQYLMHERRLEHVLRKSAKRGPKVTAGAVEGAQVDA
jgi:hypothetical protein